MKDLVNSPCNTCTQRQEDLDPQGCFKGYSSTGYFGRIIRRIFGCVGYKKFIPEPKEEA